MTVTQNKIKEILNEKLFDLVDLGPPKQVMGLDSAAQAIAEMLESQPVDRVRAMVALTSYLENLGFYSVPDNCCQNHVWQDDGAWLCDCEVLNCDHIRAVEMYLKNQK